jgi:hypothetical protein
MDTITDTIVNEVYWALQQLRESLPYNLKAQLCIMAVWTPEMTHDHNFTATIQQMSKGRDTRPNTKVVSNTTVAR